MKKRLKNEAFTNFTISFFLIIASFIQSSEYLSSDLSIKTKKEILDQIPGFLNQVQTFRQNLQENNNKVPVAAKKYFEAQGPKWLGLTKEELKTLQEYNPDVKSISNLWSAAKQTAEVAKIALKVNQGLNASRANLQKIKPMFDDLASTAEFIGTTSEGLESFKNNPQARSFFIKLTELAQNQSSKLNALGAQTKTFLATIESEIVKLQSNMKRLKINDIKNSIAEWKKFKFDDLTNAVKQLSQTSEYKQLAKKADALDFDSLKNEAINEELMAIKANL